MAVETTTSNQQGPIEWDDELGAFVVTGFDEASAVLRSHAWSVDPVRSPLVPPELLGVPTGLMLFTDPPDHTRLRRLIAPVFAARAIEELRPRIAAITESCLDELSADGDELTVDLLNDFAYILPIAVMAELLDVGIEGAEIFLDQTPRLVQMLEINASDEELADAVAASFEITMFLTPILSSRRTALADGTIEPGDDFITAMLASEELSLDEVLATVILLLAAGHETTANLIGNGALALLRDPAQLPALQADPARAVEELMRREGPVKLIGRTALEDQEISGVRVAAGQAVLMRIDRADQDPRRWPDPERLDLTRNGPAHLGFGTGIHFCLGAALARLEAAEALPKLFSRYPGLRLADPDAPSEWRDSTTFHGLQTLPVRLTP